MASKKRGNDSGTSSRGRTRTQHPDDSAAAIQHISLDELILDADNPRLGKQVGRAPTQSKVLDTIVDLFGIDDVLSSIAVNGYFEAEPLVGVRTADNKVRVREGNRRLAACLILAGDDRARNQTKRTSQYRAIQEKYGQPPITEVPVLIQDDTEDLLSYLGVRHIAPAQPWDSYAKAAWVAEVLEQDRLSVEDVSEMIGDQHRTVARILEGYYFVNQLIEKGRFNPTQSQRAGRGCNPDYPFSWIYTALGHKPIRSWLGLGDLLEATNKTPLKQSKLDDGGALLTLLFGDKGKNRPPSISDSREISELAKAVADPDRRQLLKRGKSVAEVEAIGKPPKERISDGLYDAQEALRSVLVLLSEGEVTPEDALVLLPRSKRVKNIAVQVHSEMRKAVVDEPPSDEDDA